MQIHDIFHVDLLILYHETEAYGKAYPQLPPELIDGEEEYEVSEIITDCIKRRNKKKQYLIRWKGYAASEDSWVDAKDLHAPELLEEYLRSKA